MSSQLNTNAEKKSLSESQQRFYNFAHDVLKEVIKCGKEGMPESAFNNFIYVAARKRDPCPYDYKEGLTHQELLRYLLRYPDENISMVNTKPFTEGNYVAHERYFAEPMFPKYLMKINGERKFMTFQEAYRAYDFNFAAVDFGRYVLNADFSVRKMTDEDKENISKAADEYSESK